ncbi:MAG TPA: hypothetical protein VGL38_06995 [bacterium]
MLEVREEEIDVVDDVRHVLSHKGIKYCVLAEDELEDILLRYHKRLNGLMPDFMVQYMHLPAARKRILEALRVQEKPADVDAERILLCTYERNLDDMIRNGLVDAAHDMAAPDDEERPGRFFIYAL